MLGEKKRRVITLISAILTVVGTVIAYNLTESFKTSQSWLIILAWLAAGASVTYLLSRLKERSDEDSPEAIKARVGQLHSELRSQVQSRSYGARSKLIAAPLKQLALDITPRIGLVRDPRLTEPEPISEEAADIIAAFTSSKRRLLIVGEPGAGKTTAAYALIEHLDETEGDERVPLLVNLSAWEAQDNFQAFLVDYLLSVVGYQVRERAVASTFISSNRYSLILDGLDEIPSKLRTRFSERLDEFVRGLPSEVAVVVTCRTHEYEELLAAHPTGLGLVQAVEMLPLTCQQLDSAFVELAKFDDKDWETLLTQRHLTGRQRARDLLSSPLFLNLAVAGRLRPGELLDCYEERDLRDLVLQRYLDRVLAEQSEHEPKDVRRYLRWIAWFLNGAEVSPFGLKTTDSTVFDLTNLTPPYPPKRYRLFEALVGGLGGILVFGLIYGLGLGLVYGPVEVLVYGLLVGLSMVLLAGWPFRPSAVSDHLTLVWPSTRQQLLDFLGRAAQGLVRGMLVGLLFGLVLGVLVGLGLGLGLFSGLDELLRLVLVFVLVHGLVVGVAEGLVKARSVLITYRSTPKEAISRSLVAALFWLLQGLVLALLVWVVLWLISGRAPNVVVFGVFGLLMGMNLALRHGGWFVSLQNLAYHRLAQAGKLPPRPYDFLEWGIEQQIFGRVGGGVRFRHSLIQQHLANTSVGELV